MKYIHSLILAIPIFILSGCAVFDTKHPTPEIETIPVGKNWQIIEEPPKLSDGQGRPPFQTEQSVQPELAKPAPPAKNRTIETPL